jgi:guanylate kinase
MPLNESLSQEAKDILATKVIVPIVGISAIGKNALMLELQKTPGFHQARGFTTRPKRSPDEDAYREHYTNVILEELLAATGDEELVQYAVHGQTGTVYGTMLKDYAGSFNIKDVLSTEVQGFRDIGFEEERTTAVVAEPEQWQHRFNSNNFTNSERLARVKEGIGSLAWCLDQGTNISWLVNQDGRLQLAARQLMAIAYGRESPYPVTAMNIGARLYKHLHNVQIELERAA